jgi:hypothetical protein
MESQNRQHSLCRGAEFCRRSVARRLSGTISKVKNVLRVLRSSESLQSPWLRIATDIDLDLALRQITWQDPQWLLVLVAAKLPSTFMVLG